MSLDGLLGTRGLVSLNGALWPFQGVISHLFSPFARLLVSKPLVPRLFLACQRSQRGRAMINNTGSTLDRTGIELYQRLVSGPDHVAAALGMMANWNLDRLRATCRGSSRNWSWWRPAMIARFRPNSRFACAGCCHRRGWSFCTTWVVLSHEERPADISKIIVRLAASLDLSESH